jgi:hypothetical protein
MDAVLKLFKPVTEIGWRIFRIFNPPRAFSWQTLLYLSVFSWIMAALTVSFISNLISLFGWIFLILATAWYTTDNPLRIFGIPLGALITGGFVSVFVFGGGRQVVTPQSFVLWPTITALITGIPEFFEAGGKTKVPNRDTRQRIIILIGLGMVISCWLQFYFVMENWLQEFPTLRSDTFNRRSFVVRWGEPVTTPTNGMRILNGLDKVVEDELGDRPWSEVERWLLEARQRVGELSQEVIQDNLNKYDEKGLWRVQSRVTNLKPVNSGYNLELYAIWNGPSSDSRRYYLRKSCRIAPIAGGVPKKNSLATVSCSPASQKPISGLPPEQK